MSADSTSRKGGAACLLGATEDEEGILRPSHSFVLSGASVDAGASMEEPGAVGGRAWQMLPATSSNAFPTLLSCANMTSCDVASNIHQPLEPGGGVGGSGGGGGGGGGRLPAGARRSLGNSMLALSLGVAGFSGGMACGGSHHQPLPAHAAVVNASHTTYSPSTPARYSKYSNTLLPVSHSAAAADKHGLIADAHFEDMICSKWFVGSMNAIG